jgi:alkyl sulfatase BDS1-like metallo-beta-lactamase superfamily hydrolase
MSNPVNCEALLHDLITKLNPDAAKALSVDIQFIFSGLDPEDWYLSIRNGQCTLHKGIVNFANLTIRVDKNVWHAIQSGRTSWAEAMMQRKFIATGNMPLLARLPQIFGIGQS